MNENTDRTKDGASTYEEVVRNVLDARDDVVAREPLKVRVCDRILKSGVRLDVDVAMRSLDDLPEVQELVASVGPYETYDESPMHGTLHVYVSTGGVVADW